MAEIVLTPTHLQVKLSLAEHALALHRSIEVPLENVRDVQVDPGGCRQEVQANERFVGMNTDEVSMGVRHVEQGPTLFCLVREGHNVVGIDLEREKYARILIEVSEPADEVAQRIMQAVDDAKRRQGIA